MDLRGFLGNVSDDAVFTSYAQKGIILFDGKLHFLSITSVNECQFEVIRDVLITPSIPIPTIIVEDIFVSASSQFIVLQCERGLYFLRMHVDFISGNLKADQNEYFCETFSIHPALYQQKSAPRVSQIRELRFSDLKSTYLAILSSDSTIRFYDVQKQCSFSVDLDFGKFMFEGINKNNTFGLGSQLVSFDVTSDEEGFTLIAIDSDSSIYSASIYSTFFTGGESARIQRVDTSFTLPLDPVTISFVPHQFTEAFQVVSIVSGGNIVQHLVMFIGELVTIEMFVQDQLELPYTAGEPDPKILKASVSENLGVYELSTLYSLYLIDCSPWIKSLGTSDSSTSAETVVQSILSIEQSKGSGKKSRRGVHVSAVRLPDEEGTFDVIHVAKPADQQKVSLAVSRFPSLQTDVFQEVAPQPSTSEEKGRFEKESIDYHEKMKPLMESMKVVAPIILDDEQDELKAITAVEQFLTVLSQRAEARKKVVDLCLERCFELSEGAECLKKKANDFDDKIVEESQDVEELKASLFALKERSDQIRKKLNQVSAKIDENVPLTALEIRMFQRLQAHTKTIGSMTMKIPQLAIDLEAQKKSARTALMKTSTPATKYGDLQSNANVIALIEKSVTKLSNALDAMKVV